MTPQVTAWSYSRYSDYTRCPLYFKLKHLTKEIKGETSPAMQRGDTIHKLAENYLAAPGKRPAPEELRNFAEPMAHLRQLKPMVEQNWGFKSDWNHTGRPGWFGEDVWLRVKCDVAIVYDDNTGEVIDHKTGRKYETNEDQVELFAAATFMRFPVLTHVTTRLWYLDIADPTEQEVIREYDAADGARIRAEWDKRVRPMFADRKFAPRPNDKCRWCPASRANGGSCKF